MSVIYNFITRIFDVLKNFGCQIGVNGVDKDEKGIFANRKNP